MTEPHERLQQARQDAGYDGPTEAARAFGWNEVTYRAHERGARGLKRGVAEKYAAAYRKSAGWLLTGEGSGATLARSSEVVPSPHIRPIGIPVVGIVEAGAFREVIEYDDDEGERVFEEPDPEFPQARRFAARVQGDSMNAANPPILEGARVVLVDFDETGLAVEHGSIVLVERTKDGGQTREWSLKEVVVKSDRTEYHPRSTNKRHKPIVVIDSPDADGGEQVQVLGLLRSVSYEVLRPGRRR